MKTPYANLAFISREKPKDKIENYLLSLTNLHSRPRAIFFRSKGFNETNMDIFEKLLLNVIYNNDVCETITSKVGKKYIVDGKIQTPRGETINLRTVWVVEVNKRKPIFVTAYPHNV